MFENETILDLLSEAEANRYNYLSSAEPLTREEKNRRHFYRVGGMAALLAKQKREREGVEK